MSINKIVSKYISVNEEELSEREKVKRFAMATRKRQLKLNGIVDSSIKFYEKMLETSKGSPDEKGKIEDVLNFLRDLAKDSKEYAYTPKQEQAIFNISQGIKKITGK